MEWIRKNVLLLVIFCTGAAVLVIEIVAVRILSPYFGNTIFNFSSVLSTILAALSLGYYFGGKWADRDPKVHKFFGVIVVSGVTVLAFHAIAKLTLPLLAYSLTIVTGPLISALLFFALPGFLLGLLSPYVVALQKSFNPDKGVGTVSGEVFFWGTAGSISGSIGSGFFLIPSFGTNAIMIGTGTFLVALGAVGLIFSRRGMRETIGALVVGAVSAFLGASVPAFDADAVFARDGVYERVAVIDQEYAGKPARVLLQDRTTSGAIFRDRREQPFGYADFYKIATLLKPDTQRALVIGGGAYIVPRELLLSLPAVRVEVVEIEPMLYDIAVAYFDLPIDARLRNVVADGRRYLHDVEGTFDYIMSDAYQSLYSIPSHLVTREFFSLAREKLSPGGVFHANFMGTLRREHPSVVFSAMKTFQEVFPNSYFYAVQSAKSEVPQNFQFIGINGDGSVDDASGKQLSDPFFRTLTERRVVPTPEMLAGHKVFTDGYSPVDYYAATTARRVAELPGQ